MKLKTEMNGEWEEGKFKLEISEEILETELYALHEKLFAQMKWNLTHLPIL